LCDVPCHDRCFVINAHDRRNWVLRGESQRLHLRQPQIGQVKCHHRAPSERRRGQVHIYRYRQIDAYAACGVEECCSPVRVRRHQQQDSGVWPARDHAQRFIGAKKGRMPVS
jgi:hypothetical protein